MMTFKDLKKLVELPSYKEQRVPTVKALEVSGVPVVTEKVLENHGSINVYQNGYVIYRAHKRVTVFSLRDCVHYKYDAAEGAGHHIEEAEFDDYEWHIRLVLEGEDPDLQKQLDAFASQHPEVCQRKTRGEAGGVTYQVRGTALTVQPVRVS